MAGLKDLLEALKMQRAAEAASTLGGKPMLLPHHNADPRWAPNGPATLLANVLESIDPNYWQGAPDLGGGRKANITITQLRDQFRANMVAVGRDPSSFTWNDLYDPKLATINYKGQQFLAGDLLTRAVQGDPALAGLFGQTKDKITQGMADISSRTQAFIRESLQGLQGPSVPDRGKGERRTGYDELLEGVPLVRVALHDAGTDPDAPHVRSGLPSDAPGRFTT